MFHWKSCTTIVDIEGDFGWTETPWQDQNDSIFKEFELDAWEMPIETFKHKWNAIKLQRLGKYHCSAGYTDRLHPEKSWMGKNPETLAKYRKFIEDGLND